MTPQKVRQAIQLGFLKFFIIFIRRRRCGGVHARTGWPQFLQENPAKTVIIKQAVKIGAPNPAVRGNPAILDLLGLAVPADNLEGRLMSLGLVRRLSQRMAMERTAARNAVDRLVRSTRMIADAQLAHDELQQRLLQALPQVCAVRRMAQRTARARLMTLAPRQRIEVYRSAAGFLKEALSRNNSFVLERMRSRLHTDLARLSGLNPAAILARGYSIVRLQSSGSLVRRSLDVRAGDMLQIEMHQGSIDCLVERVHEQ